VILGWLRRSLSWVVLMVIGLSCVAPVHAVDSEGPLRARFRAELLAEFNKAFYGNDDYTQLERIITDLRKSGERMPSGIWKQYIYYSRLGDLLKAASFVEANKGGPEALSRRSMYWANFETRLAKWKQQFPGSQTPYLLLAQMYINFAWSDRGVGYASSVTPEGWRLFRERLANARTALDSYRGAKTDPRWIDISIELDALQGLSDERLQGRIRDLVKQAPDYHGAWFTAALYLQPRWGGSYEAIEQLVDYATRVNTVNGADKEFMYARIYWSLSGFTGRANLLSDSRVSWPRLNESFKALVARYPEPWNLNTHASFACFAGDMKTLNELLQKISEPHQLDVNAWDSSTEYDRCRNRAEAFKKNPQPLTLPPSPAART
jgi:hypothetical protein